jgi:hypothetical protein
MRKIIVHYHLFKNAGSSVDAILKRNFNDRFDTVEFKTPENRRLLERWISNHPLAQSVSSHTAQFPLPELQQTEIYPIVFLRHPLDRLQSAYYFQRKQVENTPGNLLAKSNSIADYFRQLLSIPQSRLCRNQQTYRLARLLPGGLPSELDRAVTAVKNLPFVGVVEDFELSASRMGQWLEPHFPNFNSFQVRKNARVKENVSLDEKLESLRREIGTEFYQELLNENMKDICLHHAAGVKLKMAKLTSNEAHAAQTLAAAS